MSPQKLTFPVELRLKATKEKVKVNSWAEAQKVGAEHREEYCLSCETFIVAIYSKGKKVGYMSYNLSAII